MGNKVVDEKQMDKAIFTIKDLKIKVMEFVVMYAIVSVLSLSGSYSLMY